MNVYRELKYARNSKRTEFDDINDIDYKLLVYSYIDYDISKLFSNIEQVFGKITTLLFREWLDGYTIKELEEKYLINNLYYKFGLIKKYIKQQLNILEKFK